VRGAARKGGPYRDSLIWIFPLFDVETGGETTPDPFSDPRRRKPMPQASQRLLRFRPVPQVDKARGSEFPNRFGINTCLKVKNHRLVATVVRTRLSIWTTLSHEVKMGT
jgi:hypothetical protein